MRFDTRLRALESRGHLLTILSSPQTLSWSLSFNSSMGKKKKTKKLKWSWPSFQ